MSKKLAVRSGGSDSSSSQAEAATPAKMSTDNAFAASQLPGRNEKEVADEKEADTLAYKVVQHMRTEGQTDMREADPRSDVIPPMLAAAFEAVAGVDVSETPMWTTGADHKADEMGAEAFALDEEIWMPMGGWKPADPNFMFLIAHEVAHVALNHVPVGGPTRQHTLMPATIGFLKRGSVGDDVRDLQNGLVNLGFMTATQMASGPGTFGRKTHTSVLAFQAANGLVTDGRVGKDTRAALVKALVSSHENNHARSEGQAVRGGVGLTGSPAIRSGDEGVMVKELQRVLNTYGVDLFIDGEFGPKTVSAVRGFQTANGLKADGIVGPGTADVLMSATAKDIPAGGQGGSQARAGDVEVNVDDGDPRGNLRDSRLHPEVRKLAIDTITELQAQGLSPYVMETYRSFSEQNSLYAQGRSKPGQVVTGVTGGGSWHNYGLAVDIVFWNNAHTGPSWDAPNRDWQTLGNVGLRQGFTRWLGNAIGDYPHLEYHPSWGNRASNLRATHAEGGLQAVWDKAV